MLQFNIHDIANKFVFEGLFMTITNANFDQERFDVKIREGLKLCEDMKNSLINAGGKIPATLHESANWTGNTLEEFEAKNITIGVFSTKNEDLDH